MAEVGRAETPIFTWNPVEQMWVQERGGATKAPPTPHDIHAIQTWFLDPDEKEWIQTVLGPMGRQLAAQWRGAYRVPEQAVVRKTAPPKKRSPLPLMVAGVVLVALIGGVAVAAPGLMNPPSATPAPGAAAPAAPATSDQPAPTDAATPEPTVAPTDAPATARPATPRPRPAGPSVTLRDGSVVYYTGPVTATRGGTLLATFTVIRANGTPGTGSFGVFLNDPQTVSNRRAANGTLDGSGRIALSIATNVTAGNYQLLFSYAGDTAQIATVVIR